MMNKFEYGEAPKSCAVGENVSLSLLTLSLLKFPWVLNMEPYTVAGMARQDCSGEGGEGRAEGSSGGSPRKKVTISENYELVGVVVHSGQAHAGHYYSFIKDRR